MATTVVISGDAAAAWKVVSMDSLMDLHRGQLISADTMSGNFSWKDHITGETHSAHVPPRSIKIIRR